jgi:hypothetical protein
MELMARSVHKDRRDLSVLLGLQVQQVQPARRARMELMAQRAPQDLSDPKVQWDLQVQRERTELTAPSDPKVPRDRRVQPGRQAPKDLSGRKG